MTLDRASAAVEDDQIWSNCQASLSNTMNNATGALRPDLAQYLAKGGLDKESALYKAAARIQSRYRGYVVRKVRTNAPLLAIPGGKTLKYWVIFSIWPAMGRLKQADLSADMPVAVHKP